ncbi:hypothetical protein F5Y01DRAFT_56645 [Xylaria sp. FL0043]|nr:hypothetical protein F5Y01DRAFT_56645 [Xylaria sp. FL0043]
MGSKRGRMSEKREKKKKKKEGKPTQPEPLPYPWLRKPVSCPSRGLIRTAGTWRITSDDGISSSWSWLAAGLASLALTRWRKDKKPADPQSRNAAMRARSLARLWRHLSHPLTRRHPEPRPLPPPPHRHLSTTRTARAGMTVCANTFHVRLDYHQSGLTTQPLASTPHYGTGAVCC